MLVLSTDTALCDADQLLALHFLEQSIEDAGLGPASHPGIDPMPVAKACVQPSRLAAVLCDVEDRVDGLPFTYRDITALHGQKWLDATKLSRRDFHAARYSK